MKLYKGTGCQVKIIGILAAIPTLHMNEQGDFITTIQIQIHINTPHHTPCKQYDVIVLKNDALHIRRYGFPGLYLWIQGVFHSNTHVINGKNTHIIAEKIIFLDGPEPSESNRENNFNKNSHLFSCSTEKFPQHKKRDEYVH